MMKFCFALIMVVVMVGSSPSAQAQDIPKCATALDPCGPFVNSTTATPPKACCSVLQIVIEDQLPCLCNIFSSVQLLQTLSVNVTEALTLPMRCNLQFNLIAECQALLAPSVAPTKAPSPASHKHLHKHSHKHMHSMSPSGSPTSAPGASSESPSSTPSALAPSPVKGKAASNIALSGSALLGSFLVWAALYY